MNPTSPNERFKHGRNSICPSCGGSVGVNDPDSFYLKPTNRARGYLNGLLVDLRNFTRGMDAYLASRLADLPLHDVCGTPYAREELLHLISSGLVDEATNNDLKIVSSTGSFDARTQSALAEGERLPVIVQSAVQEHQAKIGTHLSPYGEYRNISLDGESKQVDSQVWADFFELSIDTHDFARNFAQFPAQIPSTETISREIADRYVSGILGVGLERRSNGLLLDLACHQRLLRDFLKKDGLKEHLPLIKQIVSTIRPAIAQHLTALEDLLAKQHSDEEAHSADAESEGANSDRDSWRWVRDVRLKIEANIHRAWLLLLLLHGHVYRNLPADAIRSLQSADRFGKAFHELFLARIFVFDEDTQIPTHLLSKLLNSRAFLQDRNSRMQDMMPKWMQGLFSWVKPDTAVHSWLIEIDRVVSVYCNCEIESRVRYHVEVPEAVNANSSEPDSQRIVDQSNAFRWGFDRIVRAFRPPKAGMEERRKIIYEPCGYALTNEKTFSVVILGSMGSGKTCAFESALARLWKVAEALGINLKPVDADSLGKMEELRADVRSGFIKQPTDFNFTINIEASDLPSGANKLRLSLLDIPGETVFSLISGSGADSELRRILKSANAVVFLYDMWCDDAFKNDISNWADGTFDHAISLAQKVAGVREQREGTNVDQRILLDRLCDLLVDERGEGEARKLPFVCIFPKSDLLLSDDLDKQQFILSPMFNELRQAGLLVQGSVRESDGNERMRNYTSNAGVGLDMESQAIRELCKKYNCKPFEGGNPDVNKQLTIARLLDCMTQQAFAGFGQMLSPDHPAASKAIFASRVQRGVLDLIKDRFPEHYFLPVSALGESPEFVDGDQSTDTGDDRDGRIKQLGHPPNSLLVEYIFLIPLMLAFRDFQSDTPRF